MTDQDLYDALAAVDPARDSGISAHLREQLLRQIKATPPTAHRFVDRRPWRRRIIALPAGLLGVAVAVAIVGWVSAGDVREPFIERAYAAAAPSSRVVHLRTRSIVGGPASKVQQDRTDETWLRPNGNGFVNAATLRDRSGTVRKFVIAANRTHTKVWSDGKLVQQFNGPPNPSRAGFFDPDATFRQRYEAGKVRDTGTATVDGRQARTFEEQNGDARITYAVDATTLRPIRWTTVVRDLRTDAVRLTSTYEIPLRRETNRIPPIERLLGRR